MTLVTSAGVAIAKAPGGTVLESVPETDPKIKVLVNVYDAGVPDGTVFPAKRVQLKYRAGQIIRQSQWDAMFPAAEVATVTPSSGGTAGGTAITLTGKNYTPGMTINVGGNAATSVVVVSPEKATAVTPAGTAGAKTVSVTTAAGTANKSNGFTYS